MQKINIILYEDKTATRESLCELFEDEPGFELKAAFPNCNNVVEDIATYMPEIIIMDIDMPGLSGVEGLRIIRQNYPTVNVIMYTGKDDDELIFECLQLGAAGYIMKGLPYLQLLEYIRIVYNGGTMFSPSIASKVRDFFLFGPPKKNNIHNLSEKESEALSYLCDGLSQKLIAAKMGIANSTVAAHLKSIFLKLEVHSAPEAVAKSIRNRLLNSDKLKYK